MPLSTDVNLPKSHQAKFPNRCVVCGADSPGSKVRLITHSIGWRTIVTLFIGKPFTVRAPACSSCGWWLHVKRLLSLLTTIALSYIAIWYVWPLVAEHVNRSIRRWVAAGIGLICLSPLILFETLFPDPFDITAFGDSVDYEFRDPEYAYEFAELNDDAEWVKIS